MSTKLSETAGIGDKELKDLTARIAWLRQLECVASALAGRVEQRLANAGQHFCARTKADGNGITRPEAGPNLGT
jgi:hypothetical protein